MNSNRTAQIAKLRTLLNDRPLDSVIICQQLGISQPTLSRLWKDAGIDVVSFGAARATRYGIARELPGIGSEVPIFRVDQKGNVAPLGLLRILQNNWYAFITDQGARLTLSEGLPFFMQDMRPQGFLGRLVPQHHSDLKLPDRIVDWTDDDVLTYLVKRGEDVGGDLVVGSEAYLRLLTHRPNPPAAPISARDREKSYPVLAVQANEGSIVGSSAGGEQPKFVASIMGAGHDVTHVIVKFSAKIDTASGRRWADMLVAEQLAARTLAEYGIAACRTEILIADGRYFLEVTRFDRVDEHGRAPMVSLTGIDCMLGMLDKPWSAMAGALADKGWLSNEDLDTIRTVDLFGALIGNTDRHPGNLSLSWSDDGTFRLLPIYDMLPMMYRPNTQGEIVEREFTPASVQATDLRYLPAAIRMADRFWQSVLTDARISDDFKVIAEKHRTALMPLMPAAKMRMPSRETKYEENEALGGERP
jgi:hypothetical protein